MLAFLTSLRHPDSSKDYSVVERCFEMTARSVCNQTDDDFRLIVVCNQIPDISFVHDNITYVEVDFPPAAVNTVKLDGLIPGDVDKCMKLAVALLAGREFQPDHYMLVDADDLVSRNLSRFSGKHPSANGWYVDSGYILNAETGKIKKRYGMVRYCGSTIIFRADTANQLFEECSLKHQNRHPTQEELLNEAGATTISCLLDHSKALQFLERQRVPLQKLPFPGAVHVKNTGENQLGRTAEDGGLVPSPDFINTFGALHLNESESDRNSFSSHLTEVYERARSWAGSRWNLRRLIHS